MTTTISNPNSDLAEDALQRLFTDAASARDPYPLYARLRENAPMHRAGFLPVWVMSGYPEVDQAFRTIAFGKRDDAGARFSASRAGPR